MKPYDKSNVSIGQLDWDRYVHQCKNCFAVPFAMYAIFAMGKYTLPLSFRSNKSSKSSDLFNRFPARLHHVITWFRWYFVRQWQLLIRTPDIAGVSFVCWSILFYILKLIFIFFFLPHNFSRSCDGLPNGWPSLYPVQHGWICYSENRSRMTTRCRRAKTMINLQWKGCAHQITRLRTPTIERVWIQIHLLIQPKIIEIHVSPLSF